VRASSSRSWSPGDRCACGSGPRLRERGNGSRPFAGSNPPPSSRSLRMRGMRMRSGWPASLLLPLVTSPEVVFHPVQGGPDRSQTVNAFGPRQNEIRNRRQFAAWISDHPANNERHTERCDQYRTDRTERGCAEGEENPSHTANRQWSRFRCEALHRPSLTSANAAGAALGQPRIVSTECMRLFAPHASAIDRRSS